jgi:threonine/homoserine/homoserine lactone efflux protein
MIFLLLNFVSGAVVSFLGSLPIGILNVTIVKLSLQHGAKQALYFALACAWVEMGYSLLAVQLTTTLVRLEAYRFPLHLLSISVLFIAGIYYLQHKPVVGAGKKQKLSGAFYQGVVLSLINIVAVPFWLFYTVVLQNYEWVAIGTALQITWYVAGIALGTFLGLLSFAALARLADKRLVLEGRWINRIVGVLLLATSFAETLALFH